MANLLYPPQPEPMYRCIAPFLDHLLPPGADRGAAAHAIHAGRLPRRPQGDLRLRREPQDLRARSGGLQLGGGFIQDFV